MLPNSRILTLALAATLLAPASFAQAAKKAPAPKAVQAIDAVRVAPKASSITATEMKMHIDFLASQELGGRYTLSPGLNIAARYIATRLEAYGYKGGAKGEFFQPYSLVTAKPGKDNKSTATLTTQAGPKTFTYPAFRILSNVDANVEGPLVFAGYGYHAPDQNHDDYAGLDVKGKIVVLVSGRPKGVDTSRVTDENKSVGAARSRGALAILMLPSPQQIRNAQASLKQANFAELMANIDSTELADDKDPNFPIIRPLPEMLDAVTAALGIKIDDVNKAATDNTPLPKPTGQASLKLHIEMQQQKQTALNVIGVLEGTDPKLKNEYIAVSAHFDHLKTRADGTIYPGADDDGSGTAALLNLAKAFSEQRPKRSVLVIFHSGEELGLFGSQYNTAISPSIPLERIVTVLNMDMIGRSKPAGAAGEDKKWDLVVDSDSIYVVGADRISSELQKIMVAANDASEKLRLDYTYNDPKHPEQIYFRSDHWNYAKFGVPIIFFFDGVGPDYHQVTDTPDKIDYRKMERVARLVFNIAWNISNRPSRLKADVPQQKAATAN